MTVNHIEDFNIPSINYLIAGMIIQFLIKGLKIWFFFGTSVEDFVSNIGNCQFFHKNIINTIEFLKAKSKKYLIQKPGDIVITNCGELHWVINIESSICLAKNFLLKTSSIKIIGCKCIKQKNRNFNYINIFQAENQKKIYGSNTFYINEKIIDYINSFKKIDIQNSNYLKLLTKCLQEKDIFIYYFYLSDQKYFEIKDKNDLNSDEINLIKAYEEKRVKMSNSTYYRYLESGNHIKIVNQIINENYPNEIYITDKKFPKQKGNELSTEELILLHYIYIKNIFNIDFLKQKLSLDIFQQKLN
jgi:hypothetical protein